MNDMSSDLYSNDLLPGNHKAKIEALDTQKEKAEYFLDNVIEPGMAIGYTGVFNDLLRVMENSDNRPLKDLAGKIKKSMSDSEEKQSALLNASHGHFGVLPHTGKTCKATPIGCYVSGPSKICGRAAIQQQRNT